MMSDHWKAIARLLGAAGAADAAPPVAPPTAKPEPAKSSEPAKSPEPPKTVADAAASTSPVPVEEPKSGSSSEGANRKSGFGAGLISGAEEVEVIEERSPVSKAERGAPKVAASRADTSRAETRAETPKGGAEKVDLFAQSDDLLNFSSFKDLDDEREKPARDLFGTAKGSASKGPGSLEPETKGSARAESEGSRARSGRGVPESAGDLEREEDRDVRGPKGLERLFGEAQAPEEPSTWDKLVDRLGVEEPEDRREARKVNQEVTKRPSESDAEKKLKGERGGFGSGLGFDFDEDADEPFAPKEDAKQQSEPARASRPARREIDWKPQEDKDLSVESLDPLAELGGEGWGRPRNKGRGRDSRESVREPEQEQESRSGKSLPDVSFTDLFDDDGPATSKDSSDAELSDRGARRGQSGRPARDSSSRDSSSRDSSSRDSSSRGSSSEARGSGDSGSGARGGRSDRRGGAEQERGARDSSRREERPAARGFADDLDVSEAVEREATESEESGGRGGRRGRRRGQRQRMGEEPTQTGESRSSGRTSQPEDDLFDFEDISDDPMDGTAGSSSSEDLESGDVEGESGTRRRRRRGRRRRGAPGEAAPERVADERPAETSGRAIDAEFDDDHEDDEEAVALRRSRRRRRRRSGSEAESARSTDDFGPETEEIGSVDSVVYDPEDPDDEVAAYNTQRNVPTWLDAVDILVNSNIDTRKRDPKRAGGGSSGGSNSGGSSRPRSRR